MLTNTFSLKYDNTCILLDEDNNLEEEIIHLFNEVSIFISKFEKSYNQSGCKYTQNVYRNFKLQTISSMFSSIERLWFSLEQIFSIKKKSMTFSKLFLVIVLEENANMPTDVQIQICFINLLHS